MKKSIFLFFAAILCAMSANAATYLAGSMNGWSSNNSSYEFKGSPLTLNVELPGKTYYEFKIVADGSWKGNSGEISNSISNWTFNSGDNCKLNTNLPGVYKFVWNSGKLSVTYPEAPAPHDITVRAKVPASWTNVKAWVWTSENGEGTEITPEKEGDYYVVTKNAGALFVIYKNGTGWSNGDKNQTVDLVYTEDVCLQLNQSGNAKATATVIDCGAVAKDITVKAVVPEAWGDNVWAHVWETGASGTDVKLTEKEGNWYVYTKNCLELNIIFKSGEGWSNIEQTADITGVKENACYSISSINKTDGKCNVTVVDCDAVIEPEVKPEDIYTVVGSSAELGLEWNPAKEANDMEKQGDGSYKKVYSNVELTSDVEWKIAKNDNWWNETPLENKADNGNSVLVIAKSGIYNVTFTLSADLKTAHAEAELLEETNTVADCFVSGNAALTGGAGWAGNEFKMEYDPATETYSYTLTGLAAETAYELQVVLGGNWYGYEKLQTIPTGVENKEGHIAFTLAEAGDVTITYHATNGINLTGNFAEPVTYDYYLTGTLVGGWSAKQQGIEKDGELYKATFNNLAAGTYQFKITDGQFNTEEDKTHEHTTLGAEYKEVSYVDGNIQINTEEAINLTVIFDATADKITFEGLTVSTAPTKYYVKGSHNNWTADATSEMTLDGDVYKKEVTLAKDVEFKINDGANGWWGKDNLGGKSYNELEGLEGGNLKMKEEKTFTIIFNPSENLITFDGLTEVETETLVYTVTVPAGTKQCYIAGDMNGWTAQPMTPAGTNKFSISIDNVTIATGYKYTCKDGDDTWAYVEKKNGNGSVDNRTYNANDVVERWNRIDISDGENAAIIGSHAGKGKVEVYVDRELKAGQLYTISLPFAVADADGLFGSGTEVYEYAELKYEDDEYALYFDNTKNAMEAGKPYLVKPGSDRNGFEYKNTDVVFEQKVISKTVNNTTISMESVLSVTAGATTNGKYWLASDNCLYNVSTALKSLRAVFNIQSNKANVRARVAFGENVETGVDNIVTTDAPVKAIVNGQLIIIRDGVKYNVQGQKL